MEPKSIDPMVIAAAAVLIITAAGGAVVAIIKQLQAIHHLVNSAATQAVLDLAALRAEVAALQAQRVSDAQRNTALAQNVQAQSSPASPVVATQVVEHQVVDKQSIKK